MNGVLKNLQHFIVDKGKGNDTNRESLKSGKSGSNVKNRGLYERAEILITKKKKGWGSSRERANLGGPPLG